METSLHRQLKQLYAGEGAICEHRLGKYRIDAVKDKELIEIQHGKLAAIRDKVQELLKRRRVRVVKPLISRKLLIRLDRPGGKELSRRLSPKQATLWDLFHELVYFTRVFPHKRLTLEVPLVQIEETRYPGHGKRRRWRKNDFIVADQRLVEVGTTHVFTSNDDLLALLPPTLAAQFDTSDLAAALVQPRWFAQRIAYVLRQTKAVEMAGKRGRSQLYSWQRPVVRFAG
jgi:hypothetical protein